MMKVFQHAMLLIHALLHLYTHVQPYMCYLDLGIYYWCSLVWKSVTVVSIYCCFHFICKYMHYLLSCVVFPSLYSSVDCTKHHWGHTPSPVWLFIYQDLNKASSNVWRVWS